MKVKFIKSKDGHSAGEVLDVDKNSFQYIYWMKKGVIEDIVKENAPTKPQKKSVRKPKK